MKIYCVCVALFALSAVLVPAPGFAAGWTVLVTQPDRPSPKMKFSVSGVHDFQVPVPFGWLTCFLKGTERGTGLACVVSGTLTVAVDADRSTQPQARLLLVMPSSTPGTSPDKLYFFIAAE